LISPVIGESGHGEDTSEANSGFVVPELPSGCRVTLGELFGIGPAGISLDESLLAVAIDTDQDGTDEPGDGDGGLDDVELVDRSWPAVGRGM
jgi:hypothetical protein